jgi:hypothetical protein
VVSGRSSAQQQQREGAGGTRRISSAPATPSAVAPSAALRGPGSGVGSSSASGSYSARRSNVSHESLYCQRLVYSSQRSTVAPGVRKTDRVARFQQMQQQWSRDRCALAAFAVSLEQHCQRGCGLCAEHCPTLHAGKTAFRASDLWACCVIASKESSAQLTFAAYALSCAGSCRLVLVAPQPRRVQGSSGVAAHAVLGSSARAVCAVVMQCIAELCCAILRGSCQPCGLRLLLRSLCLSVYSQFWLIC